MLFKKAVLLAGAAVVVSCLIGQAKAAEPAMAPTVRPAMGTTKLRVGELPSAVMFYEHVFGMQEVARYDTPYPPGGPNLVEVALKFGETKDQAKANPDPGLVLMFRPSDKKRYEATDVLPNFVINIPDMDLLLKRVAENNYVLQMAPLEIMHGVFVAMVKDPSGNVVECIQIKKL